MTLPKFVSASAAVLLGWLAVTFFHKVPSQRYPRLDKIQPRAAVEPREMPPEQQAQAVIPVSFSH